MHQAVDRVAHKIVVTPDRRIVLHSLPLMELDAERIESTPLQLAFELGPGQGLLSLDGLVASDSLDETLIFWQGFGRHFLRLVTAIPELAEVDFDPAQISVALSSEDSEHFLSTVPPSKGSEYIDSECLGKAWQAIDAALKSNLKDFGVENYFKKCHPNWSMVGKVCFHLAENKKNPEWPFAFLATFAHQLSKEGKVQHLPLGKALEAFAGAREKDALFKLLSPIHRAASESKFLKVQIDSGEIFQTLAWSPNQAYNFLADIPVFEGAGIIVKIPNWWKQRQANRPQVAIRLGENSPSVLGLNGLLDFSMSVMLGDSPLSQNEVEELLSKKENLIFFKGQWIEVDREKLSDLLLNWKKIASEVKKEGLSFSEGLRWLSGFEHPAQSGLSSGHSFLRMEAGVWLTDTLDQMKNPEASLRIEKLLSSHLKAKLRPYQKFGVQWLHVLHELKLGGVLADDMGLGKTIQVISLLLVKAHSSKDRLPSLLVVPASLLGNWQREIMKFAPSLKIWMAHPSGEGTDRPENLSFHLIITTYGSVAKLSWLHEVNWSLTILDEAQAIKNPGAKQTKAVKGLKSIQRLALTGTPIENHLGDLWSLFDFVSPGLLGSSKDFEKFLKSRHKSDDNPYASLRRLVKPYILRRLKTDKSIINDLPDKTEMKVYCPLSRAQIALYQDAVASLAREIEGSSEIKRRGVVLAYLMRFKQICNHPSLMLKEGVFSAKDSGKFQQLKEICEIIASKQEKVLIFTQFKGMTEPIAEFLKEIFGEEGLVLHGDTPIKKRMELVENFQKANGPPFFVLSLKAGGTGLNLTAASHVIHFDRWWNPATENQATDRAFRIGQINRVMVHKFICRGTLEEKIDSLIESKVTLSHEILESADPVLLTELSNEDLMKIVTLDLHAAEELV